MNLKSRKGGCLWSLVKLAVLVVVVLLVIVYFAGGYLASPAVKYAGKMIGIDMGLGSLSYNLGEQSIKVGDFYISNPEGFSQTKKAIDLNEAFIDLDLSVGDLLGKDLIVIDEVKVDGFEMSLEYAGGALSVLSNNSNLTAITDKLSTADKKETAKVASNNGSKKEYKVIIKKIIFTNGKVNGAIGKNFVTVTLPNFEIKDIGVKEGGVSFISAGTQVFAVLTTQAIAKIASDGTGAVIDGSSEVKKAGEGTLNKIKSIFDGL